MLGREHMGVESPRLRTVPTGAVVFRLGSRVLLFGGVFAALLFALLRSSNFVLRALGVHFAHPAGVKPAEELLIGQSLIFISAAVALVLMASIEKRPVSQYWLTWNGAFRTNYWMGMLWGVALDATVMFSIWGAGGYSIDRVALSGVNVLPSALLWATIAAINGIGENLVFYSYPLFTLTRSVGFWTSAIILSLLFTCGHLVNAGENAFGLASIFLQVLFLAFTVLRTGDLWFSFGLHTGVVFTENFVFSAPDSGVSFTGQLFHASFHGPAVLTGGSAGPEASALAFAIMFLGLIIFNRAYPQRRI
jgi:membrane protease YdiL (CAAX protease family)